MPRFALLLALSLTGCMPIAPLIYVPLEGNAVAVSGHMCEPSFKTQLFAQDGTFISIVLRPRSEVFTGSLLVDIPAGRSFKFQSGTLTVEGAGQSAMSVTLNTGRYRATEQLEGFAVAEFSFGALLPSSPAQVTVTLPPMELDHSLVQVKPATFVLRHQPMVVGLCQ